MEESDLDVAPPGERLSWRFPLGCAIVAAVMVVTASVEARKLPLPERDAPPAVPDPFAGIEAPARDFIFTPPPLIAPALPPARVSVGAVAVSGRLPADIVKRFARQSHGRVRLCYQEGLRHNPNLTGRVTLRLVIGRDGRVSLVSNGGSDLPDGAVVSCVARVFEGRAFPAPEGGIVTVVYPILLRPG